MRKLKGGVPHVAAVIEDDLEDRDTGLSRPQRIGLADLTASLLATHSVNTSELANVLPRDVKSDEERYRYINRWLSNNKIDPIRVMNGFIPELLELMYSGDKTAILMMDQSKISNGFECLMVSVRMGERALPVGWRVITTKGNIGFDIQNQLLKRIKAMIPEGMKVMLTADRFYGTSSLISLCQSFGWQYRIRLKGNLILHHQGGQMQTGELASLGFNSIEGAELNKSGVKTCIGVLMEEGHNEPWIIAMDCKPSRGRILDYGMRWGIEAMFSDFKTRGFGITKTQLKDPKRIERLILILTVGFYWAASTGMYTEPRKKQPSKKRLREA
ncbi:transposase [Chlamydiales bacterium]|nr:transposase [Chlamydiales bacterium]